MVFIIQLVESYRAILEQAQSITGVTYLTPVNGNTNGNASAGGRPTSASSVHRGAGQGALTQEVMDGMLQNATYGMQMLDVALRAKTLQGPGPPTSQHYPQHQPQHPSQPHHQPPLNSTSSLTAPSTQVQPTTSTTSVTAGSSSGSSYGYNTNSHPHPQQSSNSNSSSPRIMKDGGGGSGMKGGADDGGRKVKSEGVADKGVPTNGTSAGATPTTAAASVAAGATGAGVGSTAPAAGGDRSKRQVGLLLFAYDEFNFSSFLFLLDIENR